MAEKVSDKQAFNKIMRLIAAAIVLYLLYFGREVLIPVTLAVMLAFLLAPAVRKLRHWGVPAAISVILVVMVFTASITMSGIILGGQVMKLAGSLPQYETTIREKIRTLNQFTLKKIHSVTGKADLVMQPLAREPALDDEQALLTAANQGRPIPVEVHQPEPSSMQLVSKILNSLTGPVETLGLVLMMLVFVLLEHEALRDRFIRLIGYDNLRATTTAVNDAGSRLSRFFISQFAVNGACGLVTALALALAGVPQAILWGAMMALMRFIPYIGAWIAAGLATLLAFAISPGWDLALLTIAIFIAIEVLFAQVIEPQLYGHTTGLSPLSVVLAAVFWNWLWGPVGLVLSTPLTLCLVVAGRYIPSLNFLEILLGEVAALSLPEKFYQRALAGDAEEAIRTAQSYIKQRSIPDYCDKVLIPALNLAQMDFAQQAITDEEKKNVGSTIAAVLMSLEACKQSWWRRRCVSVLEGDGLARQLIHQREQQYGVFQGPIDVAPGSVILVLAVGDQADELAAETLVRVLRAEGHDARHIMLEDIYNPPPEVSINMVAAICLVSVAMLEINSQLVEIASYVRSQLSNACLLGLCVPNRFTSQSQALPVKDLPVQLFRSYTEITQALASGKKSVKS